MRCYCQPNLDSILLNWLHCLVCTFELEWFICKELIVSIGKVITRSNIITSNNSNKLISRRYHKYKPIRWPGGQQVCVAYIVTLKTASLTTTAHVGIVNIKTENNPCFLCNLYLRITERLWWSVCKYLPRTRNGYNFIHVYTTSRSNNTCGSSVVHLPFGFG